MRWKDKRIIPKEGDIETRKVFALFPISIKKMWIWLEWYYEVYQFKQGFWELIKEKTKDEYR